MPLQTLMMRMSCQPPVTVMKHHPTIDQALDSFVVPQPQQLQQPTQTQQQPSAQGQHHSSNSSHNTTTPLNQPPIFKMAFGSSIIWFFPSQFSQFMVLLTEEMFQMHVHSLLYCWQNFIFSTMSPPLN